MVADLPQAPDVQEKRPYGETLRGVRGGVQDVAVKRLTCSTDGKLEKFVEVQNAPPLRAGNAAGWKGHTAAGRDALLPAPMPARTQLLSRLAPIECNGQSQSSHQCSMHRQ